MRLICKLKFERCKHFHSIKQPLISLNLKYFMIQIRLRYPKSILQSRSPLLLSYCMCLDISRLHNMISEIGHCVEKMPMQWLCFQRWWSEQRNDDKKCRAGETATPRENDDNDTWKRRRDTGMTDTPRRKDGDVVRERRWRHAGETATTKFHSKITTTQLCCQVMGTETRLT